MYFFLYLKGYISQTKKLGAVGLPTYRSFSLEEIEAATNYFDTVSLMGEDSYGKVCYNVSKYFAYIEMFSLNYIHTKSVVLFPFIDRGTLASVTN